MFCDEVLDAIEPIAAGELTPEGRIAAHLASCHNCAAALESARRVDRLLRSRPAPKAPSQFTARTLSTLRRQRWRSEQMVDVAFNVGLGLVVLAIVGAVWILMRQSGLTVVGSNAVDLFGVQVTALARRTAPSLSLYGTAGAILGAALGLWWWAERDATP